MGLASNTELEFGLRVVDIEMLREVWEGYLHTALACEAKQRMGGRIKCHLINCHLRLRSIPGIRALLITIFPGLALL
jgi:hypothetical protein